MTHLLIEGICIGGLSSVISVDLAELIFAGLDPVVKKCTKYFGPEKKPKTAPSLLYASQVSSVSSPTFITATLSMTAVDEVQKAKDEIEKQERNEKEAKLRKRHIWKRLVRVLILVGLAYLIISLLLKK